MSRRDDLRQQCRLEDERAHLAVLADALGLDVLDLQHMGARDLAQRACAEQQRKEEAGAIEAGRAAQDIMARVQAESEWQAAQLADPRTPRQALTVHERRATLHTILSHLRAEDLSILSAHRWHRTALDVHT